jgi:exosortase
MSTTESSLKVALDGGEKPKSLAEVWDAAPAYARRLSVLLLALLTIGLYARVIRGLAIDWWEDPNYSHGLLIPFFVAFVFWRERARYRHLLVQPSNAGLLVMIAAIVLLLAGSLGSDPLTARVSLLMLLAGLVLVLAGRAALRAAAFPLGCLVLMIPIPTILLNQIVVPLQSLASRLATTALEAFGYAVLREGNILNIGDSAIEVAEACSGIRSLFSIIALAVGYGYITKSRLWVRLAIVVAMVPVTIAANAVRVVSAGLVAYHLGPERVEGFLHTFSGLLVFATAVGLMVILHRMLEGLVRKGVRIRRRPLGNQIA